MTEGEKMRIENQDTLLSEKEKKEQDQRVEMMFFGYIDKLIKKGYLEARYKDEEKNRALGEIIYTAQLRCKIAKIEEKELTHPIINEEILRLFSNEEIQDIASFEKKLLKDLISED